jgi:uncharacterized protein (DUF1697 family)
MPVYIALLRGINIGAHKRVKMDKLRASCEALAFDQVKTYIQSGNVVFRAGKLSPATIAKKLEEQIVRDFGFSSDVIIRTKNELAKAIKSNPLVKKEGIDEEKLHVVFLSEPPTAESIRNLELLIKSPDRMAHSSKEIYFFFPNGVSGSSLWKHPLDRILSVTGTMRNWRTVNTLYQMAGECG